MKLRDRIARFLLLGFDPDEIDDVLRDVEELSARRRGRRGSFYFWTELMKYPVSRAWDTLRSDRSHSRRRREREGGMESMWNDVRYASRALLRSPGFTVMAIAIISVSMGAATAIFSVVDRVLLEPLPGEDPDRIVSLWLGRLDGGRSRMTPGNFVDVSELDGVFSSVAAFGAQTASLSLGDQPVFLRGSQVTPHYFETLGVQPIAGRTFDAEEGERGGPSVVILSHHVWEQMFGADPEIIGTSANLGGGDFRIIGVLPPGVYPTHATVSAELPFSAANQDFFVPLTYGPEGWANRRSHILGMIGRLAPTLTPGAAQLRLEALSARLRATEPLNANERILLTSFEEEVVGNVRLALLTLLATVGLVLFIAIVNVGALFVLRSEDRQPQMVIRAALGAPKARLVRQMILESGLIAAASSLGAIAVAGVSLRFMKGLVPYQIPRLADVTIDGMALTATAVAGVAVALVFGLAPAGRLRDGRWARSVGRGRVTASAGQRRVQGGVVAVQAALCVVVLVGAALLSRSYAELRAVDTGFDARETWAMSIPGPLPTLLDIARDVRSLPNVQAAAIAYDHPLERNWGDGFGIEGVERSPTDPPMSASLRPFGEAYFQTAGIQVVEGRVPDGLDMAGDVAYAVVNRTLAETFFPGASPVGSRIILPTAQRMLGTDGLFEVVGVVEDVRFLGPDQPVAPALYVPLSHFPVSASTLLVRPTSADVPILESVRRVVAEHDASLGVQTARQMGDVLGDLLARPRFNMMLLLTLGLIGLVLSGLGAYGLVSRTVAMRTREIGIRMALGADRPGLARGVMATALRPMVLGGLVGLVGAFGLAGTIQSLLFGVSALDPVSFAASPSFVLLVGALAAAIPTLRAISIDPVTSLREE